VTSGASDRSSMNFFSRSSRPTGPEDAGGARLAFVVDQHRRVLVEADVGAVLALRLLGRALPITALTTSPFFTWRWGWRPWIGDHDHVAEPA